MKKRIIVSLIIVVFTVHTGRIYANLEDNEKVDLNEVEQEVIQTANLVSDEPKLNSRIGLIYDRASGKIIYEKSGNKQTPMASTTKIMTAIVVLENTKLSDIVTINSKAAGIGGSRLGLKKDDKITVNDLLYGLMLCSGNDAAIALAMYTGGSVEGFAELMNKKAQEIELVNTHFVVPHGLDTDGHYTTAYELAKTADYALKNKKFKEIVSTKTYTVTINGQSKTITNTNELLGSMEGVYGVKTGFTNGAGRCLVTACKKGDLDIIIVVLGADVKKYRTSDSIQLIQYAEKNYQIFNIKTKIEEEFEEWKKINQNRITINKAVSNILELNLESINYEKIAIKNTQIDNIQIEINVIYYLEAPVLDKSVIGNLKIKIGDEIIEVLQIYNENKIEKKDIKCYLLEFLQIM